MHFSQGLVERLRSILMIILLADGMIEDRSQEFNKVYRYQYQYLRYWSTSTGTTIDLTAPRYMLVCIERTCGIDVLPVRYHMIDQHYILWFSSYATHCTAISS